MFKFKKLQFKDYKIIAEKFLKLNPYGQKKFPTDIEVLITKSGFKFDTELDLLKQYGVKGLVAKNTKIKGDFKILLDENHYSNQEFYYPFTMAEELSHIILHSSLYENVNDVDSLLGMIKSLNDDEYRKYEQQARMVASHLLLPHDKLNDYVLTWVGNNLSTIRRSNFAAKDSLSSYISDKIHRTLCISKFVLERAINNRYPGLIIDNVLDKYGTGLIK